MKRLLILLLIPLLITGCAKGVPQEKYKTLLQEKEKLEKELEDTKAKLLELEAEVEKLKKERDEVKEELEDMKTKLEDAKKYLFLLDLLYEPLRPGVGIGKRYDFSSEGEWTVEVVKASEETGDPEVLKVWEDGNLTDEEASYLLAYLVTTLGDILLTSPQE